MLKEFLSVTLTQARWLSTYCVCQEIISSTDGCIIIFLYLHNPFRDAVRSKCTFAYERQVFIVSAQEDFVAENIGSKLV